jgi:hypothetical protein
MTGALEPVGGGGIEDRTREMRALLTVSDVRVVPCSQQDALVLEAGIRKQLYAPNRNLAGTGNRSNSVRRLMGEPGAYQNPEVANEHPQAGQDEELGKLAAADVFFIRAEDGKLIPPQWFRTGLPK